MKIGIVDLDTSHPQNWIPIERDLGHEVVGVWDGGTVHPRSYVEKFAADHNIPKVYDSLDDLAAAVDCAILHGCDWDMHVEKARPFVAAGKSVLLDKPIAGSVRDLNWIRAWAADGSRIIGGSSLRYCVEVKEWLAQPEEERGTPHTVLAGCGVDEFNYGIHAYSMLFGIMGPGAVSVRSLGERDQKRILITWSDGRVGLLTVGKAQSYLPFHATIVTARTVSQFKADSSKLYRAQLETNLPYLAGEAPAPFSADELIEPELCAVAALKSWSTGHVEVALDTLSEADPGYDGPAFGVEYRKMRYPES